MPMLFAEFSEAEWAESLRRILPAADAIAEARIRFEAIERAGGSNGYSLTPTTWALLALLNEDAAARVARMIRLCPPELRARIDAEMTRLRDFHEGKPR